MVNTTALSPLMECSEPHALRTGRTLRTRLRWRRGRQASAVPRLYQATDAAGDGVWDWDMASGAVWYSPRWQTMLGFAPGEVPPHVDFWRSRVHPEDLPLVESALAAHLAGERPVYECEHRVLTKSGAWLWILDRGRVVAWNAEGRPSCMIGTHVDISARKRIEEELAESRMQLDAILDNAPVGVLLVDRDRVIRRVNKSVAATFQHRLKDIVGCSARVIYGDDRVFEEVGRRAYPRMQAGGQFDEEVVMRRADGADIRCRLIGRSVKVGDPARGYVWVVEDVTVRWRAEQALNDRAGFQRVLLDTVPVPIFVQDVMGHYVDANSAFERWMGIDRQALFGRTVFDLAPPHIAEADEAADKALLADQKPQSYETQLRSADGTLRDVLFSKAVYCRTGGKPAGIVGAVMDISERKHAEQALLERQQLFEQIFVASCAVKLLIDPADGRIVDANPAAAEFYGYPLDRLRSMHIQDINAAPRTEVERNLHHAGSAGQRHFQFRHRLASGDIRDVEVYISNIVVHGRTLLMSLVHDITERCLAAAALRRKTRELERSNAELEAFAYVASHDLRQPLRVINSYLTLLERGLGKSLDEEGRECIDFARDGAQRMDRLIVDLLEYSRVGRKAKPFRPVPLEEPLRLALLNLEVAVQDAGATVTVEMAGDGKPPAVAGDDNELMRLFQNLIGNAVKYREPGRPPIVRVAVAADRQDGAAVWRIDIRDNGIGIAAEDRERVFGIFQRLHRRDEYEGTGVGLAVCKKIVEHHGGRLWVDDLPADGADDLRDENGRPCGSLFRLVLPALDGQEERGDGKGGGAPSPP
ncbi:PAS domain S-box-containing protein [Azospirillum oryzae]|uniref:histidine kinase n=1 Tax=Azospirillum oryzae TaxID=286727 RepID=A0A1X7GPH0_9PROT|nr:PAS domain S-box protein [Azospirillum oryzae]SMF72571.1 PAS domain S-box-containing protein [Azospirillum oryzae]